MTHGIIDPFEMQSIVTRFIENGKIKIATPIKKNTLIQRSLRERRRSMGLTSKGRTFKRAQNMGQSKDHAAYMRAWREKRKREAVEK